MRSNAKNVPWKIFQSWKCFVKFEFYRRVINSFSSFFPIPIDLSVSIKFSWILIKVCKFSHLNENWKSFLIPDSLGIRWIDAKMSKLKHFAVDENCFNFAKRKVHKTTEWKRGRSSFIWIKLPDKSLAQQEALIRFKWRGNMKYNHFEERNVRFMEIHQALYINSDFPVLCREARRARKHSFSPSYKCDFDDLWGVDENIFHSQKNQLENQF